MNIKTLREIQNKINVSIQETVIEYQCSERSLAETNDIQKELYKAYDSIQGVINTLENKTR